MLRWVVVKSCLETISSTDPCAGGVDLVGSSKDMGDAERHEGS